MDNLSVHRSRSTLSVMKEQQFEVIFNPPYSPFANPIEECFSVVKHDYKKQKLKKVIHGSEDSNEDLIEKAFKKITKTLVINCVKHSDYLLK